MNTYNNLDKVLMISQELSDKTMILENLILEYKNEEKSLETESSTENINTIKSLNNKRYLIIAESLMENTLVFDKYTKEISELLNDCKIHSDKVMEGTSITNFTNKYPKFVAGDDIEFKTEVGICTVKSFKNSMDILNRSVLISCDRIGKILNNVDTSDINKTIKYLDNYSKSVFKLTKGVNTLLKGYSFFFEQLDK